MHVVTESDTAELPEGPVPLEETPVTEARLSLGAERKPACTEPWKSLYILRRGVFPCCLRDCTADPACPNPRMRGKSSGSLSGVWHSTDPDLPPPPKPLFPNRERDKERTHEQVP